MVMSSKLGRNIVTYAIRTHHIQLTDIEGIAVEWSLVLDATCKLVEDKRVRALTVYILQASNLQ